MTEGERRAHWLAEAEKVMDKGLAERPAANTITLRDIERLAVQAGTEWSAEIQQALGDEGSQGQSSGQSVASGCRDEGSRDGGW
jgi:hypothetical protein